MCLTAAIVTLLFVQLVLPLAMINVWVSDGNSSSIYKIFSPDGQIPADAWLRVIQVSGENSLFVNHECGH